MFLYKYYHPKHYWPLVEAGVLSSQSALYAHLCPLEMLTKIGL